MLISHLALVRVDVTPRRTRQRDCHIAIIGRSCESLSIRAIATDTRLAMTAFAAARPRLFYATTFMLGLFGGMVTALIWAV
jgi:hypothetical protein